MMRVACMCLVLFCTVPVAADESTASEVVATWKGGEARRVDYESWRQVLGLEDGPEAIREFVFVRSFADLARKRQAQNSMQVQLEIEIARRKTLSAALRSSKIAQIRITDEEIEVLRKTYPDAFMRQRKLRLRSVYKKLGDDPETAESVRVHMGQLRQQLIEGADFSGVARLESDSQSRFQGGLLGFVDPDDMPPQIGDVVRELDAGEISEVIESDGAVMIFSCEEVKEARIPSADEVRAKLRANLWRMRKEEVEQSLGEHLLESAEIEMDPASEGVVLRVGDYRLKAGQLVVIMKIKVPGSTPDDWNDGARRKLLRNWAISVLEEDRAVELGLDKVEATAETLRWQPQQVLARSELVFRVDRELKAPGEKEMRAFHAANIRRYRLPEQYTLGVIRFGQLSASDGKAASQLVARAERAERQIASGELSFAAAARRYSNAPSAEDGGESRTLTRAEIGALGSVAGKAISQLAIGEHTELLRLRSGLWMFEVRGRQAGRSKTFEEAEAAIRSDMRKQQVHVLEIELRDRLWNQLDVKLVDRKELKD